MTVAHQQLGYLARQERTRGAAVSVPVRPCDLPNDRYQLFFAAATRHVPFHRLGHPRTRRHHDYHQANRRRHQIDVLPLHHDSIEGLFAWTSL